ncbi:MAG: hypothetical protein AB7G12_11605 [Thermoanaerobaculia bacterium]
MADPNPLIEQVRGGESRELQLLAAQGILPLTSEELIPLQVELAASENWEISGYARAALVDTEPKLAAAFLASGASPPVLEFFATEVDHPIVLEAILRRRDTPRELLRMLGMRLPPDLQEVLLLRQDAIIEEPRILVALESNPDLSIYSRRRIAEYREHLLPRERRVEPEVVAPAILDLDEEDLATLESVRKLPAAGERDDSTGLTENQIRSLPVPLKIKLTRGASRTLRGILIKDLNQVVAVSALNNSALSEDEVEQIAASRMVVDEVLTEITRRRDWISKYKICLALAKNPRVAVGVAVRLLSKLSVRDLRNLSRDRNIQDAVRAGADRLYRIKTR